MTCKSLLVALLVVLSGSPLCANEVEYLYGQYHDSEGMSRQRMGMSGELKAYEANTFSVSASRDHFVSEAEDKFANAAYGGNEYFRDTASLTAVRSFHKITDVKIGGIISDDKAVVTRTGLAGIAHWFYHERLQLGLDFSRTLTDRPAWSILDYDSVTIELAPQVSSTGWSTSVKLLSSPTTIFTAGYGITANDNRPLTRSYSGGVRQYLTPVKGALHANAAYVNNKGKIDAKTDYGSVDARMYDLAYLQTLPVIEGAKSFARLGYRYYREDEVTRAYGDELTLGSDLVSFGYVYEGPYTVQASVSRYATNQPLRAVSYEGSLGAKF